MISVGIIGTGDLGWALATSVARAGCAPTVYDVRAEATAELPDLGCAVAPSVADLAAAVDTVLVVVSDEQQLFEVVGSASSGILHARPLPKLVIVHSTVGPAAVGRAHHLLGEQSVDCLDAPVTGGSTAAAHSVLTCLVGGDIAVLDQARPVLRLYCREIRRVGEVGAGQVAKLVNNTMSLMNSLVANEALDIAAAYGLDVEEVRQIVVDFGTGSSRALAGTDAAGFGTPWAHRAANVRRERWADNPSSAPKDLKLALAAAREHGQVAPLLAAAIGAGESRRSASDRASENDVIGLERSPEKQGAGSDPATLARRRS